MSLILDTSILIELECGNQKIINHVAALKKNDNDRFFITIFTYAEYYFGVMKRNYKHRAECLNKLDQYLLLNTSKMTGILFCKIMYDLQEKGKPIPPFDVMIAALAIESDMELVTLDKDFQQITNLKKVILTV
ncbi:PIN domain-containing protein [Candidatus Woesearchaeota archaeon]|nr:PIN domain-containing protein [Candidatus Woesearchaeota archaeon]